MNIVQKMIIRQGWRFFHHPRKKRASVPKLYKCMHVYVHVFFQFRTLLSSVLMEQEHQVGACCASRHWLTVSYLFEACTMWPFGTASDYTQDANTQVCSFMWSPSKLELGQLCVCRCTREVEGNHLPLIYFLPREPGRNVWTLLMTYEYDCYMNDNALRHSRFKV